MPDTSKVRITGPLFEHAQGLWDRFLSLGYSPLSARNQLRLAAHLSRWLVTQNIELALLSTGQIDAFLLARRQAGYRSFLTRYALSPTVCYLEQYAVISPIHLLAPKPLDPLEQAYLDYLLHERAVTNTTAKQYLVVAQRLLKASFPHTPTSLDKLGSREVLAFVLSESQRFSPGTTTLTITALRSFLGYLYLKGEISADLSNAVPSIANWRLDSLPKGFEPQQIRTLLSTCDRRTSIGRADFAILLLMVRLGLRSCEVAALTLADINWRDGILTLRGKGREERLPLPEDIGQALARHLQLRRSEQRQVFLRRRAPTGPLSTGAIKMIVRKHLVKAGISPPQPHRLRHTAATEMLRKGASLDQIAQVLRHSSIDTTAIYAKVDYGRLRTLSQPWLEVDHD